MTPVQELLTSGEVAARFRVGRSTVRRWADTGRIPSFKTPTGQRRYRAADIEAVIAESETHPEVGVGMSDERTFSGIACNGPDCSETFEVSEIGPSQTDPSDFNCGGRCSTDGGK